MTVSEPQIPFGKAAGRRLSVLPMRLPTGFTRYHTNAAHFAQRFVDQIYGRPLSRLLRLFATSMRRGRRCVIPRFCPYMAEPISAALVSALGYLNPIRIPKA